MLEAVLLSLISSLIYDVVKKVVVESRAFEKDEIIKKVLEAIERTIRQFYEEYGEKFGKPKDAFLARDNNWQAVVKSIFLGQDDLRIEKIDKRGFDDAPDATDEAVQFFIDTLQSEMKKDRELDAIIETKKHHNEAATRNDLKELEQNLKEDSTRVSSLVEESLNKSRQLINERKFDHAVDILKTIEESTCWNRLSKKQKYRTLANMGGALYNIHHLEKAGEYFIKAYDYAEEENNEQAKINLALGNMLKKNNDRAEEIIEEVLEENPENPKALNLLINNIVDVDTLEYFVNEMDSTLLDDADVSIAVAYKFYEFNIFDDALKWLDISIGAKSTPDKRLLKAEMTFKKLHNSNNFKISRVLDENQKDLAKTAIEMITNAWSELVTESERKEKIRSYLFKPFLLDIIGESSEAIDEIKYALKLCPENAEVLDSANHLFFALGKYDDSLSALDKFIELYPTSDNRLKKAELLKNRGDYAKASDIIDEITSYDSSTQRDVLNARLLKVQLLQKDGKNEEADNFSKKILEEKETVSSFIVRINLLMNLGKIEEAKNVCMRAIKVIPESERIHLSDIMYNLAVSSGNDQAFLEKTAEIIESSNISYEVCSEKLYTITMSYFLTGQKDKCLDICNQVRDTGSHLFKEFLKLKMYLLKESTKYEEAYNIGEKILEKYPEEESVRNNMIIFAYELGKHDEVDTYLQSINKFEVDDYSESEKNNILYMLQKRGRKTDYIEFFYEICRKDPDNPKNIQSYCFDPYMVGLRNEIGAQSKNEIQNNDVVILEIRNRGRKTVVLENFKRKDKKLGEINHEDDLYQDLIGKKTGDEIFYKMEAGQPIMAKILGFESKYLYFSKKMMASENCPGMKIKFPDKPDRFQIKEIIFEAAGGQKRLEQIKEIEKQYQDRKIPFFLYSKFTGRPQLECWKRSLEDKNIGFWSSGGRFDHLNSAISTIHSLKQEGTIFDLYSLLFLFELTSKGSIVFQIIQKSFDYLYVSKLVDDFLKKEENRPQTDQERDYLKNFQGWIEEHFEIVPAEEKLKKYDHENIEEFIGELTYYSSLYAKKNNCLFFCEDFVSRTVIDKTFQICNPVWIEAFLYYSLRTEVMIIDEFYDELYFLSQCFYYPMMLDHTFYLFVIRKNDFSVAEDLKKSLHYLSGYVYDKTWALGIVMNLMIEINRENISKLKKYSLFDAVLDSFFHQRTGRNETFRIIKADIFNYESVSFFNGKILSTYIHDYEKRKISM